MPPLNLNSLAKAISVFVYGVVFLSLFSLDYFQDNGIVDLSRKFLGRIESLITKVVKEEPVPVVEKPANLPVLLLEAFVLTLTVIFLNRYKNRRSKDHLDDLLAESKDSLRQTNEFLEKWRLRRINWQVPSEYSYLDEEPQEMTPYQLEVPILHMAIVDTPGTAKYPPESGDAGDQINITDTTLLSMTSILDDDQVSVAEPVEDKLQYENRSLESKYQFLWDVAEEDVNTLEDETVL